MLPPHYHAPVDVDQGCRCHYHLQMLTELHITGISDADTLVFEDFEVEIMLRVQHGTLRMTLPPPVPPPEPQAPNTTKHTPNTTNTSHTSNTTNTSHTPNTTNTSHTRPLPPAPTTLQFRSYTFTALTAAATAAVRTLQYEPDLHYNGPDVLELRVDDRGQMGGVPRNTSVRIAITVTPVNTAPEIAVAHDRVTMAEDTELSLAGLIGVTDVDCSGACVLEVELRTSAGTLEADAAALPDPGAVAVGPDGLRCNCTSAQIGALLNTTKFRPHPNFEGDAAIAIRVSDRGQSGLGGEQRSSAVLRVEVRGVEDAPYIIVSKEELELTEVCVRHGASVVGRMGRCKSIRLSTPPFLLRLP